MASRIFVGLWGATLVAACAPATGQHPSDGGELDAAKGRGQSSPAAAASKRPKPVPSAAALASTHASASAQPVGSVQRSTAVAAKEPSGPLASFYAALQGLARGKRKRHVRIAWLGDSHAQADFWTGHIRDVLQQRFGNGGPGFVRIGYKDYRHGGIRIDVQGGWRMRPKRPATVRPWGDGAFGLGGILHAGFRGMRSASVEVTDKALLQRELRWDLCYKPGLAVDRFRLALSGKAREELRGGKKAVGRIAHLERRTLATTAAATGGLRLKVQQVHGRTDFCGLYIDTDPAKHPGVILDNLGINGARYGTALAWNEAAWQAEVKRRPPDLWIVEFGDNEASDTPSRPAQYGREATALLARLKRIRPDAACLVVGPADRADTESKMPAIVAAIRKAAEASQWCAFWDTYSIMGGRGSLRRWRSDGRAYDDGIHLRPHGYRELAARMLQDLMKGYRPPKPSP